MQHTIEEDGGELIVKMKVRQYCRDPLCTLMTDKWTQPKEVTKTDEQDLANLMARAGEENAEVSGDEDEELEE